MEELKAYAANAPLWGKVYGMNLDAMSVFQVTGPSVSAPLAGMRTRCQSVSMQGACWKKFQQSYSILSNKCLQMTVECDILTPYTLKGYKKPIKIKDKEHVRWQSSTLKSAGRMSII